MGILSFRAPALSLLVVAAMSSGAVQAAERLSMPFDCRFDGERVQMRPSEDRSYAIFGRGEHEIYTACSPVDASRCRRECIADFDCGGVRVPGSARPWSARYLAARSGRRRKPISSWGHVPARDRPRSPRRLVAPAHRHGECAVPTASTRV
jgi:hypothetical protein